MKVVTAKQMASIEKQSVLAGVTTDTLMENAGLAVAHQASTLIENLPGVRVVILVGSGNNGGDGLVTARHLQRWGLYVTVYLCGRRPEPDPKLESARTEGVDIVAASSDPELSRLQQLLDSCHLAVDAILGTGRSRPIRAPLQGILDRLTAARTDRDDLGLLALDLPTGLDCDTAGVDPACVAADLTVALGYAKPGHLEYPGADFTGLLKVVDIGIPEALDNDINVTVMTREWARTLLPRRPANSHKGTYGRTMMVVGSLNYPGAAYLAATAATRTGAGLVTIAIAQSLIPILAARLIEPTFLPLPESGPGLPAPHATETILDSLHNYSALLIGCGLGQTPQTRSMVNGLLFSNRPLPATVVDADGLNALSHEDNWRLRWQAHGILTPHAGEISRLTGASTGANRLELSRQCATRWNKSVVFKGARSVISHPDGTAMLSTYANPGLATAGTGDVLAGIIAGLVSQGVSPDQSAALGVYLHGAAGDLVRNRIGDTGMIASDLLPVIPRVIADLRSADHQHLV